MFLQRIEEYIFTKYQKHDNVIQDVEFIPDIPAITMELIEHGDLNSFLKQRKNPIGILWFENNNDWLVDDCNLNWQIGIWEWNGPYN